MNQFEREVKRIELLCELYTEVRNYVLDNKVKRPHISEKDLAITIITNDINELCKSISILINNKSTLGIDTLLRVVYEKMYFFKHMQKKSDYARAYLFQLFLQNSIKTKNLTSTSNYAESLSRLLSKSTDAIKKDIEDRGYDNQDLSEIEQKYRDLFNYEIKKIDKHSWYDFDGKTMNIRMLAESLGLRDEYTVIYNMLSGEVHSYTLPYTYEFKEGLRSDSLLIYSEVTDNVPLMFLVSKLVEMIKDYADIYNIRKKYQKEINEIVFDAIHPSSYVKLKY